MKLRFPLYVKILLWFFLNLAVLAAGFYGFFRIQFRVGLDSLLLGPSGARLDLVGRLIMNDLSNSSRDNWTATLAQYGREYDVQFALFTANGKQQAGEHLTLPGEVLNRMREPQPRALNRRPPGAPEPPPLIPPDEDPPPLPPTAPFPKFMVRTSHPTQYWVGIRAPVRPPDRLRRGPLMLIAVSSSLSGGGLFVDLTPWYAMGGGVIVLSALLWFPVIRGMTRAISQVTRATERLAEGNFDTQVSIKRADELGRLAHAVDQLGGRLKGFVTGQKRFLGDISHELCSPLARAEIALSVLEQRVGESQREAIEDVREEVRAMSALVNELLSFSKAGLRAKDSPLTRINLRELAERVVARETSAVEAVRIEITDGTEAMAEPELLARALGNLLRNALRYAGQAGPILLAAAPEDGLVIVRVADQGPGVPEEDLERLGEPFYRPDIARARESGGIGLGLAIVRTCVEACRGKLTLRNLKPRGFEAAISLEQAVDR